MNANELADWLDNTTDSEDWGELAKYYKWCKENVAPMLRQQQAEIEVLKLQNDNYWVMIEILRQKVKAQEK